MSRAAKLTLGGSSLFALSTIVFVHYAQQAEKAVCLPLLCQFLPRLPQFNLRGREREKKRHREERANAPQAMHQGVVRDMEQQRLKKERQLDFEMQRALEEEYRKVQSVHDGGEVVDKGR